MDQATGPGPGAVQPRMRDEKTPGNPEPYKTMSNHVVFIKASVCCCSG